MQDGGRVVQQLDPVGQGRRHRSHTEHFSLAELTTRRGQRGRATILWHQSRPSNLKKSHFLVLPGCSAALLFAFMRSVQLLLSLPRFIAFLVCSHSSRANSSRFGERGGCIFAGLLLLQARQ